MPDDKKASLPEAKEPPNAVYQASIEKAAARTLRRKHGPIVSIDRNTTELDCPFSVSEEEWRWMVIDTFGTRCHQVANIFLLHLVELCSTTWNEETEKWVPNEDELTTILHIVAAYKPRNEAEAALAAQIAATHMITMKLAKRAYDSPYDSRSIASFSKLARTSAIQIETMAGLKGKRRTTRQKITVRHEKHIHNHQHVHMGGVGQSEGQCDATRSDQRKLPRAGEAEECTPLPGEEEARRVVPIQGRSR